MAAHFRWFGLAAWLLVTLLPSWGWALGEEDFGNAEIHEANYTSWPGIMPLINTPKRVYHFWVNGHEGFFYEGTTADINVALKHFAAMKLDEHRLVLQVGPGHRGSFHEKEVSFDWDLEFYGGIAGHMQKLDQGSKIWSKDPVLTVYITDKVKLADLVVPAGVTIVGPTQLAERYSAAITASTDQTVRGWGCGQLAHLNQYHAGNLATIAKLLDDKESWVQLNAVGSVATFGKLAAPYLPRLNELAKSKDENMRTSSAKAITTIEKAADNAEAAAAHAKTLAQIDELIARVAVKAKAKPATEKPSDKKP